MLVVVVRMTVISPAQNLINVRLPTKRAGVKHRLSNITRLDT